MTVKQTPVDSLPDIAGTPENSPGLLSILTSPLPAQATTPLTSSTTELCLFLSYSCMGPQRERSPVSGFFSLTLCCYM